MLEFSQPEVGDKLPVRHLGPITRLDFARFSVSTDDPNRVHLEEAVAAAAGLATVIGSGGIVLGMLHDLVTCWAGLDRLRTSRLRVTAPLFPDTSVVVSGEVVDKRDGVAEVRAFVDDEGGTRLAEGIYTVSFDPSFDPTIGSTEATVEHNARLSRLREMTRLAGELAAEDDPVLRPAANRMQAILVDVLRTLDLENGGGVS